MHLPRRHIDRNSRHLESRGFPGKNLSARVAKDPFTQRRNEIDFFRHRNKFRRAHHAACGVPPAQQRFCPGQGAGTDADFGLKHQRKFVALQGQPEIAFHRQTRQRAIVHLLAIELVTVAALLLGMRHRRARIANDQVARQAVRWKHCDADAAGDDQFVTCDIKRGRHRVMNAHGYGSGLLGTLDNRQQHGKFVAADTRYRDAKIAANVIVSQARHHVGFAHKVRQALRHSLQQAVTHRRTQRFVYLRKAVDANFAAQRQPRPCAWRTSGPSPE